MAKGKGGGKAVQSSNDNRPNKKAFKKNPKTPRKTGRTIGGRTPEKIALRERKRMAYIAGVKEVN
jgi:hypothetical protein